VSKDLKAIIADWETKEGKEAVQLNPTLVLLSEIRDLLEELVRQDVI